MVFQRVYKLQAANEAKGLALLSCCLCEVYEIFNRRPQMTDPAKKFHEIRCGQIIDCICGHDCDLEEKEPICYGCGYSEEECKCEGQDDRSYE